MVQKRFVPYIDVNVGPGAKAQSEALEAFVREPASSGSERIIDGGLTAAIGVH